MKKLIILILSIILFFVFAGTSWARQGRVPGAYIVKEVPSSPLATTNVHKLHNRDNILYTIDENGLLWVLAGSGASNFLSGISTQVTFTVYDGSTAVFQVVSGGVNMLSGATIETSANTAFYVNPTNTTGDVKAISIVPQSAIAGTEWTGYFVDGSTLDPSAPDAEVRGLYIDLSGVAETNSPLIEGIRIKVPALEVAIHADGEFHQDYDATDLTAGDLDAAHHIRIDVEGATAGEVDGVDCSIAGTKADGVTVVCIDSHTDISPIKQTIAGSAGFIAGVSVFITQGGGGVTVHATDEFASTSSNTPFMVADNDQLLIGANEINDLNEIIVDLATPADKDLFLTFECSSGSSTWVTFIPVDGTDGMTESGDIESSLPADMTQQVITSAGGAISSPYLYWVRITRTRATAAASTPTEDRIRTLSAGGETYEWDKDGDLTIKNIDVSGGVTKAYTRYNIISQTSDIVLTNADMGAHNINTSSGTVHVEIPAPSTANAGLVLGPLMRDGSSGVSVWTQSGSIDYAGITGTTWYNHSTTESGSVFYAMYGSSGNSIFIINLTGTWGAK